MGLFSKKKNQFTPGIMPGLYGQQQAASAPSMSTMDKLGLAGAMLRDYGSGGGSANYSAQSQMVNSKLAQAAQQQQQQQKMAQIRSMLQGGAQGAQGGQGSVSPQMAAAAQLNPQAYAAALAKQQMGHHTVAGGSSVVTYGPNGQPRLTQAKQNFQHGNRVGTVGANGMKSYDLGASQADQNATLGHQVTAQNNLATQGLRGNELAEKIRNNDMTNVNTQFSNRTGRINANTNREKAQFAAANPTSDLGKSPLYMTDENGNVTIGQLGNGQIVQAQTPEGLSIMSPYERQFSQSQGREAGKARGAAATQLGQTELRAQQALETVDALRNHPGIGSGTGADYMRASIPGTKAKAFGVMNDQAQGQTFMQAFESLKGGGQITENESKQASQAIARLDRSQSKEDYLAALGDLEGILKRGLDVSRQKAGVSTPQIQASELPQAGDVVDGYIFQGGDPSDPANWSR